MAVGGVPAIPAVVVVAVTVTVRVGGRRAGRRRDGRGGGADLRASVGCRGFGGEAIVPARVSAVMVTGIVMPLLPMSPRLQCPLLIVQVGAVVRAGEVCRARVVLVADLPMAATQTCTETVLPGCGLVVRMTAWMTSPLGPRCLSLWGWATMWCLRRRLNVGGRAAPGTRR